VIGLLQVAGEARPCYVELAIDGAPAWSGAVYQVSVGNARYHGGGLTVAEQAAIGDGKLDLYVVCPGTFWQLLACITHLKFALAKPRRPASAERHARDALHSEAPVRQCRDQPLRPRRSP
jgi:diacylglycerol kinase family enzyme